MPLFSASILSFITRFKNKIGNNSTEEGAFYQNEWVKINSSWVISFFHFMFVAANTSELFCMAYLADIECFLYHSNLSLQISNFIHM